MADSTSNGGDAVAPQDLNLRIRAPGSSMHSTPSGFWPPLQNSNSFKRTDVSCNPLLLGATTSAPVVPAEPQREVHFHMDSILEDASMNSGLEVEALEGKAGAAGGAVPVSVHSMGVNPQLRQRSRKIMSTRRITSPITRHSDVVWQVWACTSGKEEEWTDQHVQLFMPAATSHAVPPSSTQLWHVMCADRQQWGAMHAGESLSHPKVPRIHAAPIRLGALPHLAQRQGHCVWQLPALPADHPAGGVDGSGAPHRHQIPPLNPTLVSVIYLRISNLVPVLRPACIWNAN